jgi:hypothetical protein
MIDFLVDGNDPADGFAVAQFIAVVRCSGNLFKLVPHLAGVLGIAWTAGIRQPSHADTHPGRKKPPSLLSAVFVTGSLTERYCR